MSQTDRNSDPSQPITRRERSLAEWVSFSGALIILSGIIGLVLYSWLTMGDRPPILLLARDANVREVEGKFYVPFTLTNKGGETADAVQVIAELRINGKVEEMGEQQFNFLAGGEEEQGTFVFSSDPRLGNLVLRVASYQNP